MGFPINDLDAYQNNRGLMFDDISEVLPGPIIQDYTQLINFISAPIYKPSNVKINSFYDGHSSERLLKHLGL